MKTTWLLKRRLRLHIKKLSERDRERERERRKRERQRETKSQREKERLWSICELEYEKGILFDWCVLKSVNKVLSQLQEIY